MDSFPMNMNSSIIAGFCGFSCYFLAGLFNTYLKNKDIKHSLYFKKLELYTELIDRYHAVIEDPSEKNKYVASQQKVELVASDEVVSISKEFYSFVLENQVEIVDRLIAAMRKDLEKT
jgi:hypothetical protein